MVKERNICFLIQTQDLDVQIPQELIQAELRNFFFTNTPVPEWTCISLPVRFYVTLAAADHTRRRSLQLVADEPPE